MTYSQVDTLADTDLVQLIKNDGSAAQITGASLKTALTKTVTNTVTVTVSALETPTLVFTPTGALDICPPGTVLGTLSLSGATATSYFGARGYLQTGRARVTPGTNQVVRDVLRKTKINPTQTCRFGATYVDTNGFMQTVYVDTLLGVALTSDPGTQGLSNARVISQVTLAEHAPPLTEVAILAADSVNPNYDPAYADYQPTGDGALHKFTPEKNPRDIDGHFRLLSRGDIALATKGSYSVPIVFKTAKGATVTLPVTINIVPATPEKIAEQAGVNLLAHWDNSVASTLTLNGSSVLSQTTVDGTQTFRASGSGVTYIPAGQNGRGCLQYDTSTQMIANAGTLASYLPDPAGAVTKPLTLVLILEPLNTTDFGVCLWQGSGGSSTVSAYATPGGNLAFNYGTVAGAPHQNAVSVMVIQLTPANGDGTVLSSFLQSAPQGNVNAGRHGYAPATQFVRPWGNIREFEGFVFDGIVDLAVIEQIGQVALAKWGTAPQSYRERLDLADTYSKMTKASQGSFDYLSDTDTFPRLASYLDPTQTVFAADSTPICSGQPGNPEDAVNPTRDWSLQQNLRFLPHEVTHNSLYHFRDAMNAEDVSKVGLSSHVATPSGSVFPGASYGFMASVLTTKGFFAVNSKKSFFRECSYQSGVPGRFRGDWCGIWFYGPNPLETDFGEEFGRDDGDVEIAQTFHIAEYNGSAITIKIPSKNLVTGRPVYSQALLDTSQSPIMWKQFINDVLAQERALVSEDSQDSYLLQDLTVGRYSGYSIGAVKDDPTITGESALRIHYDHTYLAP